MRRSVKVLDYKMKTNIVQTTSKIKYTLKLDEEYCYPSIYIAPYKHAYVSWFQKALKININ